MAGQGPGLPKMIIKVSNTGTFRIRPLHFEVVFLFNLLNRRQEIEVAVFRKFKKALGFKRLKFLFLKYRGQKNCFF
jgi:hypothetical protein